MLFNLNEFLASVSFTLDFVEMDILGVTSNHGKRTAYIALNLAKTLGLGFTVRHDIAALAILHDNGVSEKSLHDTIIHNSCIDSKSIERIKEHCTVGEENISQYPFLSEVHNVIKYHHEEYDGSGFFGLSGDEIPLLSQIIHIADKIDVNFDMENNDLNMQHEILNFVHKQKSKMFAPKIADAFKQIGQEKYFWVNLKSPYLTDALQNETPQYIREMDFEQIRNITGVLSKIIDAKSRYTQRHSYDLAEKVSLMADFYQMDHEQKMKMIIAADLHDIGKLAISNQILDSTHKLSEEDFNEVKKHSLYTRIALQEIKGFEEITEWASNHHEKLNGQGYPFGKTASDLDINSRLMTCLDIYQALTEDRPYRNGLSHQKAIQILFEMGTDHLIDSEIIYGINEVFYQSMDISCNL